MPETVASVLCKFMERHYSGSKGGKGCAQDDQLQSGRVGDRAGCVFLQCSGADSGC